MNHNLVRAHGTSCSPPQKPELVFYSLGSDDLLFDSGEELEIRCQAGLRSVGLEWTLARNNFTTPFRTGKADPLPGNRFIVRLATAGLLPGFYDLRVKLDTGSGDPIDGISVFGWKVAEMGIAETRPADFAEFWQAAKAEVDSTALESHTESEVRRFNREQIDEYNVTLAALPPSYDPKGIAHETVESCKVSFAAPGGGRTYGWLAKPEGKGPFPAMLVLPGAGFDARPRPLEHARHGFLALDIQIHGQDVCLDSYPKLPGYYRDQDYSAPENYYYYRVHQRVLQAINYLASREDVDASRIVVVGGSQGGRLSTIVAGLDPRVRAAIPCIAHFGNQPYLAWTNACNEAGLDGMDTLVPPTGDTEEERCVAYFDPMNFAPDVACPVLMNAGLVDPCSRPSHVFAIYKRLASADKQIVPLPGIGHDWCAEFDRCAWKWLAQRLA
jgi:cephalosporin-C deacetylase-like acetyl esterase